MKQLMFLATNLPQSALEPAGEASERIANLFYVMVAGGAVIWTVVLGLSVYAIIVRGPHHARTTTWLVIGGGALFPTLTLTALLCVSLPMLPELHRPPETQGLTIEVAGVRWWWRVKYRRDDGSKIETANEIRLPVNRPVEFKLSSEDVIHSFWVPSLGGKVDMIPGRENRLKLVPTKVGRFRGACAEYCGTQHAQMCFYVRVVPQEEFDQWWETLGDDGAGQDDEVGQDDRAVAPETETTETTLAREGRTLFRQKGCTGCHARRPLLTKAGVGPDLTRLHDRLSLGAGMIENTSRNLRRWIRNPDAIKPGVNMPAYDNLREEELDALVAYLEQTP